MSFNIFARKSVPVKIQPVVFMEIIEHKQTGMYEFICVYNEKNGDEFSDRFFSVDLFNTVLQHKARGYEVVI